MHAYRTRSVLVLALAASTVACGSTDQAADSSSGADTTTDASTTSGGGSSAGTGAATSSGSGVGGSSVGNASTSSVTGSGGSDGSTGGGDGSSGSTGGGAPACPGVEPRVEDPGVTCRSPADCANGATCDAEPFVGGCGACFAAERRCQADAECSEGERCAEFDAMDPCACGFELSSECRPVCTETSCADSEECIDGVCAPRSCENGFVCGNALVCAPDRVGSDAHGCAPINCNEGRECGTGYTCHAESGECRAVHCTEGGAAACAINTICDPEATGRGCLPKPCAVDSDCDCGVCIQRCSGLDCPPGQCARRLYVCNLPVP